MDLACKAVPLASSLNIVTSTEIRVWKAELICVQYDDSKLRRKEIMRSIYSISSAKGLLFVVEAERSPKKEEKGRFWA